MKTVVYIHTIIGCPCIYFNVPLLDSEELLYFLRLIWEYTRWLFAYCFLKSQRAQILFIHICIILLVYIIHTFWFKIKSSLTDENRIFFLLQNKRDCFVGLTPLEFKARFSTLLSLHCATTISILYFINDSTELLFHVSFREIILQSILSSCSYLSKEVINKLNLGGRGGVVLLPYSCKRDKDWCSQTEISDYYLCSESSTALPVFFFKSESALLSCVMHAQINYFPSVLSMRQLLPFTSTGVCLMRNECCLRRTYFDFCTKKTWIYT